VIPVPLLLANWRVIALGVALLAVGGYVWSCERAKANLAEAHAIAERQAVENAKQALRDIKAKERADENYERRLARLTIDVRRLRDASASLLPAAAPGSADPERACFERAELDAALRAFATGAAGLIGEGAAAIEGLDSAKEWAGSL